MLTARRHANDRMSGCAPGQVVNMSSGLGSIGGLQERMRGKPLFIDQHGLAYKMSKAALNMGE